MHELTTRLQDPFEEYKVRLAARLARQDQSDEALRKRAAKAAEREKDRTTWLGTDLGVKGESTATRDDRKRKADDAGVGKYLKVGGSGTKRDGPAAAPVEFGVDKKKRKPGGFGDFSGW
jgi:peptidyl-prolyl cis-trans isomerase-like protein 2